MIAPVVFMLPGRTAVVLYRDHGPAGEIRQRRVVLTQIPQTAFTSQSRSRLRPSSLGHLTYAPSLSVNTDDLEPTGLSCRHTEPLIKGF